MTPGQLKYSDDTKSKVQFHYTKNGSRALTKALAFDELPEEWQGKLLLKPDGVRTELPVTSEGRIDLAAWKQEGGVRGRVGGGGAGDKPQKIREIDSVRDDKVFFKGEKYPIPREKVNVTDGSLGLQAGTLINLTTFPYTVEAFAESVGSLAGESPSIDRNPYNFVEFAGDKPWTLPVETNATHAYPMEKRISGVLNLKIEALTPIFVPGGFPFDKKESNNAQQIGRHFCRIRKADQTAYYAIPGSSIKGMLRSEIEALSNSRLGVLLGKEFFNMPIPYRRRSFLAGVIKEYDEHRKAWKVEPVKVVYLRKADWVGLKTPGRVRYQYKSYDKDHKTYAVPGNAKDGVVRPYRAGLAVADIDKDYVGLILEPTGGAVYLSTAVHEKYFKNLKHPQYENHRQRERDAEQEHKDYINIDDSELNSVATNDLIYYTVENGVITTFGKNINYLWPSSQTITGLCRAFQTPEKLGLESALTMAERLFGFSGEHTADRKSHPFRGLLQFETAWGPEAEDYEKERRWPALNRETANGGGTGLGWRIEMAPLTGPMTRAKSRPLYLQGRQDGLSSSWEDRGVQLRGRKFYWPQSDEGAAGNIWKFHLKDAVMHEKVKSQLPPLVHALREKTHFDCRIHFRNLTEEELGAVLFALEGDDATHTLRIGKGKPRGLGNIRCEVASVAVDGSPEQLLTGTGVRESPGDKAEYVTKFKAWVMAQARVPAFSQVEHVASYVNLHKWKGGQQIRYYPINFSQYGWLPADSLANPGNTKGEPKEQRPPAMKLARPMAARAGRGR
jgi:CRISPR/Cas system CSM-associated protein Csm3 (group 7 of RAMP superfamily)